MVRKSADLRQQAVGHEKHEEARKGELEDRRFGGEDF